MYQVTNAIWHCISGTWIAPPLLIQAENSLHERRRILLLFSLGRKMIQIVHVTNLIVNRNFSTLAWSQSASGERFQRLERSSNLTQQWLQKEIQMANDSQFSLLPIG